MLVSRTEEISEPPAPAGSTDVTAYVDLPPVAPPHKVLQESARVGQPNEAFYEEVPMVRVNICSNDYYEMPIEQAVWKIM